MYSRRSQEGSRTPTQENRDVFDDEFAVDDFDMVADGFRPSMASEEDERHSQDPPIRSISAHYADTPDLITPSPATERNSISKTRSHENPFASPDDGPQLEFERTPSMHSQSTVSYAPGLARRSTSSASSRMFAGTQSPRFGTGGPSHPYAMYPQGTVARSPSIATTSTIQPNRNSTIQQAPQHPYGMYPQGVGEDDDLDDDVNTPTAAQAVGFPGLGQTFQRVRGPDGEEQDIVGPDGHAEQLPPYTRYPEDGPKMPILAVPGELHSRGPVAGSDPGMSLMHEHMPPPMPPPTAPQSMTDQSSLERHSMQDRGIDNQAAMPLIEREASVSTGSTEKSWKEKSWKERRKTRVCGLPLLWLIVAACVAGFIAAVVGGIMGGYASGSKHGRDKADAESSSSSSLAEASMIAAPTISPPSGTYALSLSSPTNVQSGCLIDSSNAQAWDCDLVGSPALAISVGVPAAPRPTEGAFFFYASSDPGFSYGAQYKFMDTEFSNYQAVQESGEEDKGPAFYFGQQYDKIVLLPESTFPLPSGTPKKRDSEKRDFEMPAGWNRRRQAVNHGDKPWMCVWNDTLIEGWIYVEQNITSSFPMTTSSSASSTITSNSTPTELSVSTYTSTSTSELSTGPIAQVTAALATSASASSQTASTTTITKVSTQAPWNGRGPPDKSHDDDDDDYDDSSATAGHKLRQRQLHQRQATSSATSSGSSDSDGDDDELLTPEQEEALDTYHGLPPYPYLIKIEERRVPENGDGNVPYCQQFQLLNSGELVPFTDANHPNGVKFDLAEQPPQYSAYDENASVSMKPRSRKRQSPSNACHCEWWAE